ncbi:MAG: TonB-dependent receptor [Hyphomonadaceae bacterium]|nr:TonB-dependent receptor [Hyphomonadaceae bacterium]
MPRLNTRPWAAAAVLALCAPGTVWAQAGREETTEAIVVTAPLEGSRFESLQGADVMIREDVVQQLNRGLGDTLDSIPGVATTFFGAGASRPIIRGLGEDRVRVLENGIGAIDASAASPDHAVTADGLDAERIEVLRGAAALAYGGNAIGGVVNVIDESIPTRAPAKGYAFRGLGGYSTVDEGWQGDAQLNAALGDSFVFSLGAAGRETGDYAIPDSPTDKAENSWTDYHTYSAGGSLLGDWGHVGLAVKRTESDYGLPPEAPGEAGGQINLEQTRYEARGDLKLNAGMFDRLDFGFQHSDYEHAEIEGSGEIGTVFTNAGWEGRVEAHHTTQDGKHTGALGVQALNTDFAAEGEEAFITPTTTKSAGVFALERWDLGGWGLEGGLRFERTELDNEGAGARSFDSASGSIGVFFRPAENWFLAGTLARTERAANQFELFADGPHLATANYEVGDSTLDKETATSIEGSLRYTTDALRFELNIFRASFDDYIALVQRGDVYWFDGDSHGFAAGDADPSIPAGAETLPVFAFTPRDATFTGGEISANVRLFASGAFTFRADGAADYVRAEFDGGGRPPRIPPRSLTLGLAAESEKLDARIEAVVTADQTRVDVFETPTEGYTFFNARLAYRPTGREGPFTLLVDGRNLTDELGRVHASFLKDELPLPGRSVRLALVASF